LTINGLGSESNLSIKVVTQAEALESVEPAWRELLCASGRPEPTRDPIWSRTWWRYYGDRRKLAVGLFHIGDVLVGLAPMCCRVHRYRATIPFWRIEFLGSNGSDSDGVSSDYLGIIARVGYEDVVANAFVRALFDSAFGRWDECVLEAMAGDDEMLASLKKAFGHKGCDVDVNTRTEAPYIALPANWDAYLHSLTKKHRWSIQSAMRDFVSWAETEGWSLHRADDLDSLATGFEILRELHGQRWRARELRGAFVSARFSAFHDDLARKFLAEKKLELVWLNVGVQPVAAQYNFLSRGKTYFYQCGRKIDVPKQIRLGIVMVSLMLQEAIARGDHEFDFLAGDAQYKRLFSSASRPIVELRVARRTLREELRRWAKRANKLISRSTRAGVRKSLGGRALSAVAYVDVSEGQSTALPCATSVPICVTSDVGTDEGPMPKLEWIRDRCVETSAAFEPGPGDSK
jgi:CelD/BcsL family acetyltransferase involved in cellulose biosynthesis